MDNSCLKYLFELKKAKEDRYKYNEKKLKLLLKLFERNIPDNLCIVDWNLSKGYFGDWEIHVPYYFNNVNSLKRWILMFTFVSKYYSGNKVSEIIFRHITPKKWIEIIKSMNNFKNYINIDDKGYKIIMTFCLPKRDEIQKMFDLPIGYDNVAIEEQLNNDIFIDRHFLLKISSSINFDDDKCKKFIDHCFYQFNKIDIINHSNLKFIEIKDILFLSYLYFNLFSEVKKLDYVVGKGFITTKK